MSAETGTPRTDAEALVWGPYDGVPNVVLPVHFARTLERELTAANDALSEARIGRELLDELAKLICAIEGIAPIDLDGSPNWWMFTGSADGMVKKIVRRLGDIGRLQSELTAAQSRIKELEAVIASAAEKIKRCDYVMARSDLLCAIDSAMEKKS